MKNSMSTDFVFNGKRYWYMQCYSPFDESRESMLSEYVDTFSRMEVRGYPYGSTWPGLGKIKAWLKRQ